MTTLYYHPLPRLRHRQGKSKIRGLLFWPLVLAGSVLVGLLFLLLSQVVVFDPGWSTWVGVSRYPVALVATVLLGVLALGTLLAQLLGYRVAVWVLIPALLLFAALWW